MRRGLLFFSIFLLLLLAPIGLRYVRYYGLAGNLFADRQAPAEYRPADVPQRVPTPASSDYVDQPDGGQGFVLLDRAHKNEFTLEEVSYLASRLTARGFQVSSYQGGDLAGALRSANAFIVITPLSPFTSEEVRAVADFVERGGRLLMVGDPARFSITFSETEFDFSFTIDTDRLPLNSLASKFDLVFNGDYLYNTIENEGNFRNIILKNDDGAFGEHELTEGLERLAFYGSHSLQVGPGGRALLLSDDNTWSSATDRPGNLVVAALSSEDRVLALGDVTFLTEPYFTVYNNSEFISRVADFLTQIDRAFVVADFPFFYGPAVDLIYTGSPELGAGAFDEIIALQSAFRQIDRRLSLATGDQPDHDTLYLGLYNQAEDVLPLLEKAGISLVIEPPIVMETEPLPGESAGEEEAAEEDTEDVATEVRETIRQIQSSLGRIQMAGTGLILLDESNGRRNVVVLAASKAGLENTIERLLDLMPVNANYSLTGCLLQGNIALCPTNVADEEVEARLETGGVPERPEEEEEDTENGEATEIDAELQGRIGLGETVEGTLAASEAHAWTFNEGPARIDVIVQSGDDLDAVLEVYGPDNELLGQADGSFTGGEERLTALNIPDDREYTIVIRDFFDDGGSYTLTIEAAVAGEIDAELQGQLEYGVPVTGNLAAGEAHAWTFVSDGPATVDVIVQSSEDLDAVLELYDPEHFLIERVDQTLRGGEERLEEVSIQAGEYTVVVRDFFNDGGEYTLVVNQSDVSDNGNGETVASVFILAADDGIPLTTGFTSASLFASTLGSDYEVTLWRSSQDGPLQSDTLEGYNLVIWDSGDYRQENGLFDSDTFIIFEYLEDGGNLLINGLAPALLEPAELASLADLRVSGDDPVLLQGLTVGDVIPLDQAYDAVLVEDSGDDLEEGETVFFIRGPSSRNPGRIAGLAVASSDFNDARIVLIIAPFVALPNELQTTLLDNLLTWFELRSS